MRPWSVEEMLAEEEWDGFEGGDFAASPWRQRLLRRARPYAFRLFQVLDRIRAGWDPTFHPTEATPSPPLSRPIERAVQDVAEQARIEAAARRRAERQGGAGSRFDSSLDALAFAAEMSQSEAEAEAFAGAMVPMAVRQGLARSPALARLLPTLVQGTALTTQVLRQSRGTRPLLRLLPTALRHTGAILTRSAQAGRAPGPRMAREVYLRCLGNVLRQQAAQRRPLR